MVTTLFGFTGIAVAAAGIAKFLLGLFQLFGLISFILAVVGAKNVL